MSIKTNYFDGNSVAAADLIAPWAAMLSDGVFGATDFAASADSPADLAVSVAAGTANINGYLSRDDAVTSVPIPANTSGYNRLDLIVINIDDSNCITTIIDVPGVPSSSPVVPVAGSNQLALAQVLVGNNASVINQNVITDIRTYVGAPSLYRPRQQLDIIDGNFQIVSNGATVNTPYTANGYPIWDTWKWYSADIKCWVARQYDTLVPGSYHTAQMAWNSALNTTHDAYSLNTFIEKGVKNLCGYPKLTLSFIAFGSAAGLKLNVAAGQNYGTGGSPSSDDWMTEKQVTLTIVPVRYSITFDTVSIQGKTFGTNDDDYLRFLFGNDGSINPQSTGVISIKQVQLDIGSVPLPYRNKSFEQELRACMRYYEQSYAYGTAPGTITSTGEMQTNIFNNANLNEQNIAFNAPKRAIPTVTFYSPVTGAANKVNSNNTDISAIPLYLSKVHALISLGAYPNVGQSVSYFYTADARY